MTREEFNHLSLEDKSKYALSGKYVDTVISYGFHALLYSMKDGSFCEVLFSIQENKVIRVIICNENDLKKFF